MYDDVVLVADLLEAQVVAGSLQNPRVRVGLNIELILCEDGIENKLHFSLEFVPQV